MSHSGYSSGRGGFVWQTMTQRGLKCSLQDINTAFSELLPEQVQLVEDASLALANGGDDAAHFELLRALRIVSVGALRSVLNDHSIEYGAGVMFRHALEKQYQDVFLLLCQQAHGSDATLQEVAITRLRKCLGDLNRQVAQPSPADTEDDVPASEPEFIDAAARLPLPAPAARALARPAAERPAAQTAPASASTVLRRQSKVFGQKAALTWEIAALADQESCAHPLCTVMIEGAPSNGDGRYRWDEKVVFMLTLRELPQVLAVLMGWRDELALRFHGKDKKKSFALVHQDHGVHARLSDGVRHISVPIDDADRYSLSMLALSALVANEPQLDSQAVLAVCRAMTVPVGRSS